MPIARLAMYVDGNVHGNEIQAGEVVLYTLWYLTRGYGQIEQITKLVDTHAFYLLPIVNPDGRQYWFDHPNTPHSSRQNRRPQDHDRDGKNWEDGPEDLDGDGVQDAGEPGISGVQVSLQTISGTVNTTLNANLEARQFEHGEGVTRDPARPRERTAPIPASSCASVTRIRSIRSAATRATIVHTDPVATTQAAARVRTAVLQSLRHPGAHRQRPAGRSPHRH